MKTLYIALFTALFAAPGFAAPQECADLAKEKKLAGAAQSGFMRKCVRDRCETVAAEKKLAGAARTSFGTKCMSDGLQGFCTEQAAAKKLAGAAQNSFMKKCQAGK